MINEGRYKAGSKLPRSAPSPNRWGSAVPRCGEAISALQIVASSKAAPGRHLRIHNPSPPKTSMRRAVTVLEECDSPFENMQASQGPRDRFRSLGRNGCHRQRLDALKSAWEEKCQRGRRGDLEEYLRYGKEFHLAIARATKNRVIEGIMEKLLDMTIQPLWINMRRNYFLKDPSRIELMLDVHDRIVKASAPVTPTGQCTNWRPLRHTRSSRSTNRTTMSPPTIRTAGRIGHTTFRKGGDRDRVPVTRESSFEKS